MADLGFGLLVGNRRSDDAKSRRIRFRQQRERLTDPFGPEPHPSHALFSRGNEWGESNGAVRENQGSDLTLNWHSGLASEVQNFRGFP
jgi:hypothetical protein